MSTIIWRLFMIKNRSGFTLAEVLVTLGVIGVVAVMTIPTLVTSYQKQGYVAALQKNYSMLSQAMEQYLSDQRVERLKETELSTLDGVGKFLNDYFKVTKDCGSGQGSVAACFGKNTYPKWNYKTTTSNIPAGYCVILANGAAISMQAERGTNGQANVFLYIDVNGKKGPNIAGRDLFLLNFFQDADDKTFKLSDKNMAGDFNMSYWNDFCGNDEVSTIYGCVSKIALDGWKMNY